VSSYTLLQALFQTICRLWQHALHRRPRWLHLGWAGAVFVSYTILGMAGLSIPYKEQFVTLIWPATGVAIAALFHLGYVAMLPLMAATFVVNLWFGLALPVAAALALTNTLGTTLAVWLLKKGHLRPALDSSRDLVWFLVCILGPGICTNATLAMWILWLGDYLQPAQLGFNWLMWWLGDALGALLLGLPLLMWHRNMWQTIDKPVFWGWQALMLVMGVLLFLTGPDVRILPTLLFIPALIVMWLVFSQGLWAASISVLIIATMTIFGTVFHRGLFGGAQPTDSIWLVWSYNIVLIALMYALALMLQRSRRTKQHLERALAGSTLDVWDLDVRSGELHFYGAARERLGYDAQSVGDEFRQWVNLIHPADYEHAKQALVQHLKGHTERFQTELRLRHRDGHYLWILSQGQIVERDQQHRPVRLVGCHSDITDLKNADLEVSRLRDFYATILAKVVTGVWVADPEHRIIYCNPALVHLAGLPESTLLGKHILNDFTDETLRHFRPYYYQVLQTLTPTRFEAVPMAMAGGAQVVVSGWLVPLVSQGRYDGMLCTTEDMTPQHNAEQRIRQLAFCDPLTGLSNKAHLVEQMRDLCSNVLQQQQQLVVFYLDLDQFQLVNDLLGHAIGDQLLKLLAQRLESLLQPSDLLGRLGGDEFLLIRPCARGSSVASTAAELLSVCQQRFEIEGHRLAVTACIGVALFPQHGGDFDELLRVAEIALYQAKQKGVRSYCLYQPEMGEQLSARLSLIHAIPDSLQRGEFSLRYQPLVRLADSKMVAVEALVRWQHPTRGDISPAEFIPLAEQSGVIHVLGDFVLEQAISQASMWNGAGYSLQVAVNISSLQLLQDQFVARLTALLAQYQLQPQLLKLELTESVLARQVQVIQQRLQQVQAVGVQVALDDFGTGYSSLAYLKDFHLQQLKIDRSFTEAMLREPDVRSIVYAMVVLGQSLGMEVVAEGVEHAEQLQLLNQLGVDMIQGYYISPPQRPEALLSWWQQSRFV